MTLIPFVAAQDRDEDAGGRVENRTCGSCGLGFQWGILNSPKTVRYLKWRVSPPGHLIFGLFLVGLGKLPYP